VRAHPLVHLPIKVTSTVPLITNAVVKAAHGEPPLRKVRLARAIVHAQPLLDELKSASLELDKIEREEDADEQARSRKAV
jgi:hypothetical protein